MKNLLRTVSPSVVAKNLQALLAIADCGSLVLLNPDLQLPRHVAALRTRRVFIQF